MAESVNLSQGPSQLSSLSQVASCGFCCLSFTIAKAGVLRTHGPVGSRCPGAGKPPSLIPSTSLPQQQEQQQQEQEQEQEQQQQQQPASTQCGTSSNPLPNASSFRVLKREFLVILGSWQLESLHPLLIK